MRFIGNKTKLLAYIHAILKEHNALRGDRFFDFFAGTASVGKYFREHGYSVESSDILYFSYVLQEAYIASDIDPQFDKVLKTIGASVTSKLVESNYDKVLAYLNDLEGIDGYIYTHYSEEGTADSGQVRKFFSARNGRRIDAIRTQIEQWNTAGLLTKSEYFILVASLVETVPFYANISGVYAAFLKQYDPRAKKDLVLRPITIPHTGMPGKAHNRNSMELIDTIDTDILYLDPPYNARQYAPNYHLLETIAKYDDPEIKGVAGIRPYAEQKSEFCNKVTALAALDKIASGANYKVLAMSYSTEGIMARQNILDTLTKYGTAQVYEVDYRRFKSNGKGDTSNKSHIKEQLYVLKRF